MKRLLIPFLFLSLALLLAACAGLPVQQNTAPSDEAIAAAVQATLTSVAADASQTGAAPVETPTPAQSRPAVQLPAPVAYWQSIDNKPAASRGSADAPVVLLVGAQPFAVIAQAIEDALKEK
ncbi:MAG: hypothetical protein HY328_02775 [Chloroflexi bacterium]|nr:hypothetical protein [Chloroflexota bacterium]